MDYIIKYYGLIKMDFIKKYNGLKMILLKIINLKKCLNFMKAE